MDFGFPRHCQLLPHGPNDLRRSAPNYTIGGFYQIRIQATFLAGETMAKIVKISCGTAVNYSWTPTLFVLCDSRNSSGILDTHFF